MESQNYGDPSSCDRLAGWLAQTPETISLVGLQKSALLEMAQVQSMLVIININNAALLLCYNCGYNGYIKKNF